MNNTTIHVGLDVHKKTTAIAVSQSLGRARFIGTIDSNPRALLKVLRKLGDVQEMSVVYGAGPCGYDLYRRLRCGGYRCEVIAPSKIARNRADRQTLSSPIKYHNQSTQFYHLTTHSCELIR